MRLLLPLGRCLGPKPFSTQWLLTRSGTLSSFAFSTRRQQFKPEHIIIEPVSLEDVPFRAMVLDPAISKRAGADFAAISVVGMRDNGIIQILAPWGTVGATPQKQIDK